MPKTSTHYVNRLISYLIVTYDMCMSYVTQTNNAASCACHT